jgi:cell division septation protein DedD
VELPEEIPYAENASVAAAPAQTPQLDVREENKGTETASSSASVIRVKSAEGSRYSVQIGSYPTMQEATATVEKWKTKGYPAYMMIADIPDRGRWYRVRMGGFQARSDATHYMKELKNRENLEAIVVLNEQ